MGLSDGGKIPTWSLRTRLANMQRRPDGAYRGKTVGCQVTRKQDCSALAQRIGCRAILTAAGFNPCRLLAADDHHQELVRPDKRNRRPRADSSADQAVAQAVGNVSG